MKLEKKKLFAVRTLGVGAGRIVFNKNRLDEIKQAITKQDIRDLKNSGAIIIKEIKGRLKKKKRKTRRREGSIKKKVKQDKRDYIRITRKLRSYFSNLKSKGQITKEQFKVLRKEIRMRLFRSLSDAKEKIKQLQEIK